MPKITIAFGVALILLGVGTWFGTSMVSFTALIPAFVGVPLVVLGVAAAANEGLRKHMMHAAAGLGLLGFIAPLGRLIGSRFGGALPAVAEQLAMAGICLLFVVVCVNSFVQARRGRVQE